MSLKTPCLIAALLVLALPAMAATAQPNADYDGTWVRFWNEMHYTGYQPVNDESYGGIGIDLALELGFGGAQQGDLWQSVLVGFTARGAEANTTLGDDDIPGIGGLHLGYLFGVALGEGWDIFAKGRFDIFNHALEAFDEPLIGTNGLTFPAIGGGFRWLPIMENGWRNPGIGLSLIFEVGLLDGNVMVGFDISIPFLIYLFLAAHDASHSHVHIHV